MPRFVLLAHDWPAPHLDLLLEAGTALRSWRLLVEPVAGADVPAEPNDDHRLHYLSYEGPVSGGRGTVARRDAGTFEWLTAGPGGVEIQFQGRWLNGRAVWIPDRGVWSFAAPGTDEHLDPPAPDARPR